MKRITVPATGDQLEPITAFIDAELEEFGCDPMTQMKVELAVEESFVNIVNYAYHPEVGEAEICVDTEGDPPTVTIRFVDQGKPFNPLEKDDPDVTLSAEERPIGGLGILFVKKSMDEVTYAYEDGKNILTMRKKL